MRVKGGGREGKVDDGGGGGGEGKVDDRGRGEGGGRGIGLDGLC